TKRAPLRFNISARFATFTDSRLAMASLVSISDCDKTCHDEVMTVDPATQLPECNEGSEASASFDFTIGKLLSVSHDELLRREAAYRKQALANPNRRGPKPKAKRGRRAS